ncbi:MAG: AAA family ATPase [Sphaerochaetaceae bacterium]
MGSYLFRKARSFQRALNRQNGLRLESLPSCPHRHVASLNQLEQALKDRIHAIASEYGMKLEEKSQSSFLFNDLIQSLSKIGKVVILIDEYDNLMSDNIFNESVGEIRLILGRFFEIIKSQGDNIRFAFITGVTKYAKVSVFSKMNNLNDISMDSRYAAMFGYTEEELEANFSDYIEEGIRASSMKLVDYLDKVKAQYDGYCFNLKAETVYNPVSAGQFFLYGGVDFEDYWAETGNTKLLMDIAKKVDFNMATDLSERMDASSLRTFDILELASDHADASDLKALLFQSGYLTLKCSDDNNISYFLDFPNGETRRAFSLSILRTYAPRIASPEGNSALLLKYFENGQTESAVSVLKSLYASISYQLKETDHEKIHQIVFVSIMKALGAELNAELATNKGRIDAVLKTHA